MKEIQDHRGCNRRVILVHENRSDVQSGYGEFYIGKPCKQGHTFRYTDMTVVNGAVRGGRSNKCIICDSRKSTVNVKSRKSTVNDSDLLTIQEVAHKLNVTNPTVYNLINKGLVQVKKGHTTLISKESIENITGELFSSEPDLTVSQSCAELNVSNTQIYILIKKGLLKHYKVGRSTRINKSSVDTLKEASYD